MKLNIELNDHWVLDWSMVVLRETNKGGWSRSSGGYRDSNESINRYRSLTNNDNLMFVCQYICLFWCFDINISSSSSQAVFGLIYALCHSNSGV